MWETENVFLCCVDEINADTTTYRTLIHNGTIHPKKRNAPCQWKLRWSFGFPNTFSTSGLPETWITLDQLYGAIMFFSDGFFFFSTSAVLEKANPNPFWKTMFSCSVGYIGSYNTQLSISMGLSTLWIIFLQIHNIFQLTYVNCC